MPCYMYLQTTLCFEYYTYLEYLTYFTLTILWMTISFKMVTDEI